MDIGGTEVRETKLSDGYVWEWEWPNVEKVERELRWTKEAHKWVAGMRVDRGGWSFRMVTGEEWHDCRGDDEARKLVKAFIRDDLGLPPAIEEEDGEEESA